VTPPGPGSSSIPPRGRQAPPPQSLPIRHRDHMCDVVGTFIAVWHWVPTYLVDWFLCVEIVKLRYSAVAWWIFLPHRYVVLSRAPTGRAGSSGHPNRNRWSQKPAGRPVEIPDGRDKRDFSPRRADACFRRDVANTANLLQGRAWQRSVVSPRRRVHFRGRGGGVFAQCPRSQAPNRRYRRAPRETEGTTTCAGHSPDGRDSPHTGSDSNRQPPSPMVKPQPSGIRAPGWKRPPEDGTLRAHGVETVHSLTGQFLQWTKGQPTAQCWWCQYQTQTWDHLVNVCLEWKAQQKILWAKVREESGRGKSRLTIRDLLLTGGAARRS